MAMKAKHPDAILLFRNGDFTKPHHEDAEIAPQFWTIPKSKQQESASAHKGSIELAFLTHALDSYLPKIVRAAIRVAIENNYKTLRN